MMWVGLRDKQLRKVVEWTGESWREVTEAGWELGHEDGKGGRGR